MKRLNGVRVIIKYLLKNLKLQWQKLHLLVKDVVSAVSAAVDLAPVVDAVVTAADQVAVVALPRRSGSQRPSSEDWSRTT